MRVGIRLLSDTIFALSCLWMFGMLTFMGVSGYGIGGTPGGWLSAGAIVLGPDSWVWASPRY